MSALVDLKSLKRSYSLNPSISLNNASELLFDLAGKFALTIGVGYGVFGNALL